MLIATGDRWHAPASILAAQAGKDVYSEKPCGMTIELCQNLEEIFQKTERIFQAGTQRQSVPNFQQAVRPVHEGLHCRAAIAIFGGARAQVRQTVG
ncbi:MAG: hypothetical protein R3E01_17470 [Pirellulaceae bacterium]